MLRSSIVLLAGAILISTFSEAKPIAAREDLAVSQHVLTLTRTKGGKGYNPRSAAYRLGLEKAPTSGHIATLTSVDIGEGFDAEITFGTETFLSYVDTGSSDTWLPEVGFQCVDITTSAPLPEADCEFGPLYTVTDTFVQTPDENFNITYGSGEFLTGIIGTEEVGISDFTVRQTVALVDFAAWEGDDVTSGIIGFAYPALTSAYAGTNPAVDNTPAGPQIQYPPLFYTIVADYGIPNLFSLAILRDISGDSGYLALGGLPPVTFNETFTSTPIIETSFPLIFPTPFFGYYTINIDHFNLHGKPFPGTGGPSYQYIVDSGTTLNYVPNAYADAFNGAFDPPAVYSAADGVYYVDCNATNTPLDVVIAGTKFDTNPLDLILLAGTDANGNDVCISGVTQGGDDPANDIYILGDTFQKNVVTVFDIGAGVLRFAAHEHYPSNDPVKV